MKIFIDLREPDQINLAGRTDFSARGDAYSHGLDQKQILAINLIEDDKRPKLKDPITARSILVPPLLISGRTPIYDFFMLAAGKELGSEEKILRGPSPRRQFGRSKQLLQTFVSEAEELQQDIGMAGKMLENEDVAAAIEFCPQPTDKNEKEDYAAGEEGSKILGFPVRPPPHQNRHFLISLASIYFEYNSTTI